MGIIICISVINLGMAFDNVVYKIYEIYSTCKWCQFEKH